MAGIKELQKASAVKSKDYGYFSIDDWKVVFGGTYIANPAIKLEEFVNFCVTIYHEVRHAEQNARIVQGIALSRHTYKDMPDVADSPQDMSRLTGMNLDAVKHAMSRKGNYDTLFAATPRLKHCIIGGGGGWKNWDPTVNSWVLRACEPTQSLFAKIGQSSRHTNHKNPFDKGKTRINIDEDAFDDVWRTMFYDNAEDEIDAVACENLVKDSLVKKFTNYNGNKHLMRHALGLTW